MKSWEMGLRIAGLILLFNIVPFVRGCDTTNGLNITTGFPTAYVSNHMTSHSQVSNNIPSGWATFSPLLLLFNVALLGLAFAVIRWANQDVSNALIGRPFLIALGVIGILTMLTNGIMLFAFVGIAVGIASMMSDASNFNYVLVIDMLARLLFFCLVVVGYFVVRRPVHKLEQEP